MCFLKHFSGKRDDPKVALMQAKEFVSYPRWATEDIVVYKRLRKICDEMYSPHQHHVYVLDKLETAEFRCSIDECDYNGAEVSIHEGLHSYKSAFAAAGHWVGCRTFEAVIPKGSKYYEDGHEIVSNQLIIKKLA